VPSVATVEAVSPVMVLSEASFSSIFLSAIVKAVRSNFWWGKKEAVNGQKDDSKEIVLLKA
jgi:hypothetical protein